MTNSCKATKCEFILTEFILTNAGKATEAVSAKSRSHLLQIPPHTHTLEEHEKNPSLAETLLTSQRHTDSKRVTSGNCFAAWLTPG